MADTALAGAPLQEAVEDPAGLRRERAALALKIDEGGRRTDDGRAEVVGGPGSHLVAALAASDLLIVVPEDVEALDAGAVVDTVDL